MVIPAGRAATPHLQTHEGYEWVYVLNGNLRLVLARRARPGPRDRRGRRVRHPGPALVRCRDDGPVEFLSLFGKHGERAHLRARPKAAT